MAYFAPYIDTTGLHLPTYEDIKSDIIDKIKTIYGQDIYLENDSLDYQFISIVCDKIYDTMCLLQGVYNGRTPVTAVGTNLDTIVKLNGIQRQPVILSDSFSKVELTLTGAPNTSVSSLMVQDVNGYKWAQDLNTVTIGSDGTTTANFTCTVSGAIAADPNTITKILTPTYGLFSVTNASDANLGINTETDAELRQRQQQSVAISAQSVLDSITASLLNVERVTRCLVYENDTGETDSNGIPGHTIAAVVEGGADDEVARSIFDTKTPGCGTYGTTTVSIVSNYGISTAINFSRPIEQTINSVVNISAIGGNTITDTDKTNIQKSIADYLAELDIGVDVINSSLFYSAVKAQTNPLAPTFKVNSVTAAIGDGNKSTNDIAIAFNAVAKAGECAVVVS